jgi:hypothetical protein
MVRFSFTRDGIRRRSIRCRKRRRWIRGSPETVRYVNAVAGRRSQALAIAGELADRYRQRQDGAAIAAAIVYTGLGDHSRAFGWLDKARESLDVELGGLKADPRFDSLRTDSRLGKLLATIGLPQ